MLKKIQKKENHKKCPKCGSVDNSRSKKGPNIGNKFLGCSKFPKCRGAINLT